MRTRWILSALLALSGLTTGKGQELPPLTPPWPVEKAQAWAEKTPWLVGCNYTPAYAINQLEMWQPETFDLNAIDRELTWAQELGFTSIRVFLHHLLWEPDSAAFLDRVDQFLNVADKHHIGVMFVPFDSVWDPHPKPGTQREPKKGLHNSGWVQSPGRLILEDPARHDSMKPYLQGLIGHFKNDPRIHAWDLINEPDNPNTSSYGKDEPKNKVEMIRVFQRKVFAWAREMEPSQPLTSGVWIGDWSDEKLAPVHRDQLEMSDIITFHSYDPREKLKARVDSLRHYNRPLACTEYMARPNGSRFDPMLGFLQQQGVGAYCWGFVAGKSNTIYPWDSWKKPYDAEPEVWFHDIFRPDGSPYIPAEVAYIKQITARARERHQTAATTTQAQIKASLPPLPLPLSLPKPAAGTSEAYAPQAILPGGIVVPLFAPDSPYLKADKVRTPEVYNMSGTVPGRINSIVSIHNPSIEIHKVDPSINTGTAVIVIAGGGHRTLNVGGEAADFVPFFYNYGINTIILRNRLRADGYVAEEDAVHDTQQAIRIVRAHANDWGIDPNRIGVMGFSAGAELAAPAALLYEDWDAQNNDPSDPFAGISSRPDFVGLIYPGPTPFARNRTAPPIPKNVPPAFLVCASAGDRVHTLWALEYYQAMLMAGVPNVEMHLYGNGRHPGDPLPDGSRMSGGLTDRNGIPFGTWQYRFIDWARDLGFLQKPGRETKAAHDLAEHVANPPRPFGQGRRATPTPAAAVPGGSR